MPCDASSIDESDPKLSAATRMMRAESGDWSINPEAAADESGAGGVGFDEASVRAHR